MKKYIQKVFAVILIVGIFLVIQTRFNDIEKHLRTITNSKPAASACIVGEPETYYVIGDGVRIRSSTVISDTNIIATANRCTEVKVYCFTEEGDWAKISNSSEKYISATYLSKTESCSVVNTTTTNAISLKIDTITTEPEQIRVEDLARIYFNIIDIKNVASDEADRIEITVLNSSDEVMEEEFEIIKNLTVDDDNIGTMTVNISNKTKVPAGRYKIKIAYGKTNITKTFDILKKEFDFNITTDSDYESVPENLENTWTVEFENKKPESLTFDDFDFVITKNNKDVTDTFIVDAKKDHIDFKNIRRRIELVDGEFVDANDDFTPQGTYQFTITLKNQEDYSNEIVKNYSRSFTFKIEAKRSIFEEIHTDREASRYQISYQHLNYDIDIVGIERTPSGVKKYIVRENNGSDYEEVSYFEQELAETYPNLAYKNIYFENRNDNFVAVNYNNTLYISKYIKETVIEPIEPPETEGGEPTDPDTSTDPDAPTDPDGTTEPTEPDVPPTQEVEKYFVYYYKGTNGTVIREEATEFQAANPTAYGMLMSSRYKIDPETGNIFYHDAGTGTKIVKNIIKQPYLSPLSITGGELKLKLHFDSYTQSEVEKLQMRLVKDTPVGKASQLLIEDLGESVYDSNFAMEIDYDQIAEGNIFVTIKYLSNQDKYIGDYTLSYGFGNYNSFSKFTLSDGKIDYYVYSEYDNHANDTSDILMSNYPNSNKKYEYYVGFYMKKTKVDIDNIEKESIGYRIFDRRVEEDEDGNLVYFDEVEYVVRLTRIYNGYVYYSLSTNNGASFQENLSMPIADFQAQYAEAWEYFDDYAPGKTKLKNYNLDSNGYIISDNYKMHVIRTFMASPEANDLSIEYTVDGSDQVITKVMDDNFKQANSEMYRLIATRFDYDSNNNYILGGIRGRYQIYERDGVPLEGNEVTDLFYITVDRQSSDPKRTITILPKTEVNPGFYYIYVTHNAAKGVGYIYDDDSEDAAIDRNVYPEMWMRNIHMTSLHYDDPKYDVTIDKLALSNSISSADKAYTNVESYIDINFKLNYIYTLDNFTYEIQYKNGNNWIDAKDHFEITDNIRATRELSDSTSLNNLLTNSTIHMITDLNKVRKGTYRIVFKYNNNGYTMTDVVEEFELSGNYYGINIDETGIDRKSFYHNFGSSMTIPVRGYYITNVDNFVFSLTHETEEGVPDILTWDKKTKTFTDVNGHVLFSYTEENEDIDEENNLYTLHLMNYYEDPSNLYAPVGKYTLTISYQEPNGELLETSLVFNVERDTFGFRLGTERGVANENEMYIVRNITSEFINYEDLEPTGERKVNYVVKYFDPDSRMYIDVSSESSSDRMFTITDRWEEKDPDEIKDNYNGTLYLHLNMDKLDRIFDGNFYLEIIYNGQTDEFEMASMSETFGWQIADVDIYGLLDNNGTTHKAQGFYSNIKDTRIDVTLVTIHQENAKYIITQDCANAAICSPDSAVNYNNYFTVTEQDNTHFNLKLNNSALPKGEYQLVVYYSSRDYAVYNFSVFAEYASIEFGDAAIASKLSNNENSQTLFSNKDATIMIPVKILGIDYADATISITNNNQTIDYNSYFNYSTDKFNKEHILELEYNASRNLPPGDILVMVSYTDADGHITEDHQTFKFNEVYFNYNVTNVSYNPNPAVPNRAGEIYIDLTTNELLNGNNNENNNVKNTFINNLVIKNASNEDVTNEFIKTYTGVTSKEEEFRVVLRYTDTNRLTPGVYRIYMSYAINTTVLNKTVDFTMADYERKIDITNVTVNSKTLDGLIHNNYGGTYIVEFTSNYPITVSNLNVSITNSNNTDVTNKFKVTKETNRVRLEYTPSSNNLESGVYTVNLTYRDSSTGNTETKTTEINLYGEYKEITIRDIKASTSPIIAENENQYYDFKLDITNLTTNDLNNLKFRIYDSYNNIVYSTISSDSVTNIFEIVKIANDSYRIKILPYKTRVGEYYVEVLVGDSLNNYNASNRLRFTVDQTLYKVNIFSSSTISPKELINNTNDIYDYIGVLGTINFQTTHPDSNAFSIKIFNSGRLVTEINTNYNLVEDYKQITFDQANITNGNIEFAVCINGLPYASITKEVLEYIKIKELSVIIDKQDLTDVIILNQGDVKDIEFYINPENATDKSFTYTSTNPDVASVSGNKLTAKTEGEAVITVNHRDISKQFTVRVNQVLKSQAYEIDNENRIIFVSRMTELRLLKDTFISNLENLLPEYRIMNNRNIDVTSTTEVIGTNYKIINGNYTYTVIVIGDLTCNGAIDSGDFAYLVRIVRGILTPDDNILKAGKVLKRDRITSGDVAKLYRFYRGNDDEI